MSSMSEKQTSDAALLDQASKELSSAINAALAVKMFLADHFGSDEPIIEEWNQICGRMLLLGTSITDTVKKRISK